MNEAAANWVGLVLANDRYEVTAKLGEGGMGCVYKAQDRHLDCEVVIKVPRPEMLQDPEFAGRFARECRSLVRLSHPHIVKINDVHEHRGVPFLVLQYLSAGSLRDRHPSAAAGKRLPPRPDDLRRWLPDVAEALDFIHQQRYIHRDIKPDNILFDGNGHVYLSDFGIAKVVADKAEPQARQTILTGAGLVLGTPPYMAPELILGEPYDGRVDQYALAVTVYELFSGRVPVDGPTPAAILVKRTTREPPLLHELEPGLPSALSAAVQQALAQDPRQRFSSCTTFSQAVLAAVIGSVSPARPAPTVAATAGKRVVACPHCRNRFAVSASSRRTSSTCPVCHETIPLAPSEATPAPPIPKGTVRLNRERTGTQRFDAAVPPLAPALSAPVRTATAASPVPPISVRRSRGWQLLVAGLLALAAVGASLAWVIVPRAPQLVAESERGSPPISPVGDRPTSSPERPPSQEPKTPEVPEVPPPLPVNPPKVPHLQMPSSLTLLEGGTKPLVIEVDRQGFAGPLAFQVEDLPEGVKARPAMLAEDERTVRLELKVDWGVRESDGQASVKASAGERQLVKKDLKIRVQSTVLQRPPSTIVRAGQTRLLPLKIDRKRYTKEVLAVRVEGLPEGIRGEAAGLKPEQAETAIHLTAAEGLTAQTCEARVVVIDDEQRLEAPLRIIVHPTEFADSRVLVKPALKTPVKPIWSVAYAPDGHHAVFGGEDGLVHLWDIPEQGPARELAQGKGHSRAIRSVCITQLSGDTFPRVASGGLDGDIRIWAAVDHKTLKPLGTLPAHRAGVRPGVLSLAFSPKDYAVALEANKKITLSGVATEFKWQYSKTDLYILSGGRDRTLQLWDARTASQIVSKRMPTEIPSVAFHPYGLYLLLAEDRAASKIGLIPTKPVLEGQRQFVGHSEAILSVAYSPPGVAYFPNGALTTFARGESFPPESSMAALTGSKDGTVRLWHSANSKEIRIFTGHKGPVTVVAFASDGRRVVSGGEDGTVRLWDIVTGEQVRRCVGHTGSVTSVALSPDGKTALSAGMDGTLRQWDVTEK